MEMKLAQKIEMLTLWLGNYIFDTLEAAVSLSVDLLD